MARPIDERHFNEEQAAMFQSAMELHEFCKQKDHTDCLECIFRCEPFGDFEGFCKIGYPEEWKVFFKREEEQRHDET